MTQGAIALVIKEPPQGTPVPSVTPPPAKYEIENPMAKIYRKQFEQRRAQGLPLLSEQDRLLKLGATLSGGRRGGGDGGAGERKVGEHQRLPASTKSVHAPTAAPAEEANNCVEQAADEQQSFYRRWFFAGDEDHNVLEMPHPIHRHIMKTRFSHWIDLFGISGVGFMVLLCINLLHSAFMFVLHLPGPILTSAVLQWLQVTPVASGVVCFFSLLEVFLISYRIANATCCWKRRLRTKIAKLCHVDVDGKGKPKASPLFKKVDIDLHVPTVRGSFRKIGTVRCCRFRLRKWIRQLYVQLYDKVIMRFTDQDAHFFGFYKLISSLVYLFLYMMDLNILGSQGFDAAMMNITGLVLAVYMCGNILLTFQNNKYRVRLVYQLDFFCRRE